MSRPNYRALHLFSIVALEGTFSAAAFRLSVSQSTLSQQIAKLETDLGQKLFHRGGRTLSLTPVGAQLLKSLGSTFETIELAWSDARAVTEAPDSLIVASVHTLFTYFLPNLLVQFLSDTPHAQPDIRGRSSAEVIALTLSRAVDLGLVYDTEHVHSELQSQMLFQENIVAVFHPEASWADTVQETAQITPETPLAVFQKGYALRSLIDRAFKHQSVRVFAETDNIELMLRLAQGRKCVALLPEGVASEYGARRGLVSQRLAHPVLRRNVIAVWRQDDTLRPLARRFLHRCLNGADA